LEINLDNNIISKQLKTDFSENEKELMQEQENNPFIKNILENLTKNKKKYLISNSDFDKIKEVLDTEAMGEYVDLIAQNVNQFEDLLL